MPKINYLYLIVLLVTLSQNSQAMVHRPYKLESIFEQPNVNITRSFSIRAKNIKSLKIDTVGNVELIELSLEFSNGRFFKLNHIPKSNSPLFWKLENRHIKKVTFTAKSLNRNKKNRVLIVLDNQ
ncbi:hypothetical protein A9Q84_12280 [Halobacteriovorax marinus]|uniref:Uncharacterized protein n=1 Tax=Halobacteriovorax marinus TaxID=97084 RepID=A0A1Y5FCC2_9BACT|nr:hypothetical protein A9Q84_12280 [Halobacteriovorax marinus]